MMPSIDIRADRCADLEAFLDERIYAYNRETTGFFDDAPLCGVIRSGGQIVAGIAGHTWGGCCEIVRLWVDAPSRRHGFGTALLVAAEQEARRRGCAKVVVTTHSFQAPSFYERLGYRRAGALVDYPRGEAKLWYEKSLVPETISSAAPSPT